MTTGIEVRIANHCAVGTPETTLAEAINGKMTWIIESEKCLYKQLQKKTCFYEAQEVENDLELRMNSLTYILFVGKRCKSVIFGPTKTTFSTRSESSSSS